MPSSASRKQKEGDKATSTSVAEAEVTTPRPLRPVVAERCVRRHHKLDRAHTLPAYTTCVTAVFYDLVELPIQQSLYERHLDLVSFIINSSGLA